MSLRRRALPLLLAAVSLLPSACASDGPADVATDGAVAPDVYHITQERNGQTIRVRLGQVVALLLEVKAGSPAHWEPMVSEPAVLGRQGSRALIAPRRSGNIVIAGAPGYERMLFDTLQTGSTRLRATRVRPAREGGGTVVFEVTVEVVAPQEPR